MAGVFLVLYDLDGRTVQCWLPDTLSSLASVLKLYAMGSEFMVLRALFCYHHNSTIYDINYQIVSTGALILTANPVVLLRCWSVPVPKQGTCPPEQVRQVLTHPVDGPSSRVGLGAWNEVRVYFIKDLQYAII